MIKCSDCKKIKDDNEFYLCRNSYKKNGYQSRCKECQKEWRRKHLDKFRKYTKRYMDKNGGKPFQTQRMREWRARNNSIRGYYCHLKATAKYKGREVSFSFEEFENWNNQQENKCFYCDIPQSISKKLGNPWSFKVQKRLSLDRLDSSKGYSLDNICLCCRVCNEVKNNILSKKEMKEIGQKYIKPKWQRQIKDE
jgi:hypothetical protein